MEEDCDSVGQALDTALRPLPKNVRRKRLVPIAGVGVVVT